MPDGRHPRRVPRSSAWAASRRARAGRPLLRPDGPGARVHRHPRAAPDHAGGSRDKLFWFLCGWLGGPNHYIERFGHPRLRARHLPYAIGIAERDQWMACMVPGDGEQAVDPALAERLAESFFGTADWMRNRARPGSRWH
jgi:truncated hemoglobin YjbI